MTWARRAGAALLVAVAAGCASNSVEPRAAGGPAATSTTTVEVARRPEGFTTIVARITEPDGAVCEVCLWLADDADERSRGLMGVTDLGEAVGMAFRFEEPVLGSFWMFETPTPLSIAWFAPDGAHVGSADMTPCIDTPASDCPRYSPDVEYDLAIETFGGGLEELGLLPGARVGLLAGTESDRCPSTP